MRESPDLVRATDQDKLGGESFAPTDRIIEIDGSHDENDINNVVEGVQVDRSCGGRMVSGDGPSMGVRDMAGATARNDVTHAPGEDSDDTHALTMTKPDDTQSLVNMPDVTRTVRRSSRVKFKPDFYNDGPGVCRLGGGRSGESEPYVDGAPTPPVCGARGADAWSAWSACGVCGARCGIRGCATNATNATNSQPGLAWSGRSLGNSAGTLWSQLGTPVVC